ncbi:polysaccharide pyruvyl transferase family protein [Paenarthrobacter sp. NPDC092416]|uniref:polysaccharide pyruvyl transferase family protein n=1 Tax=Paenarthrobacter sp. NPDC092416 TaxID=3364386 RepID=UPI0037F38CF9
MALNTILINGAEVGDKFLGNRGAEHLLRTCAARLRGMGLQPAVTFGKVDPSLIAELGLAQYVGNPRIDKADKYLPKVRTGKLVSIKGLSGVLDASGFALGDAWGVETAKWLQRKYRQWDSQGIPVIALPQAYGAFTDPALASMCREALSICRLVFPRDSTSAEHLRSLGLGSQVSEHVPDITIGEDLRSGKFPRLRRMVVVPNWNLAERGDKGAYVASLIEGVRWARRHQLDVVGLLHEGQRDLQLLQHLQSEEPLRIVADLTGWETKRFIAESEIVISGRYHAVLAALTTNTPVLTHSWSHKYREVLSQFGVDDWLAEPDDPNSVSEKLDLVVESAKSSDLEHRRQVLVSSIEAMWSQVRDVIGPAAKGSAL